MSRFLYSVVAGVLVALATLVAGLVVLLWFRRAIGSRIGAAPASAVPESIERFPR